MACDSCGTESEVIAGRCRHCGWNAELVERQCLHCGKLIRLRTGLPVTGSIGAGFPAFLAYQVIGKAGVMAASTFIWAGSFFFTALTVRHACSMCGREVPKDLVTEDERSAERSYKMKMFAVAAGFAILCAFFSFKWTGSGGGMIGDTVADDYSETEQVEESSSEDTPGSVSDGGSDPGD